MKLLDGREVAEHIYSLCPQMHGEELAIVTIGEDFASKKYVASKIKAAERVGLKAVNYTYDGDVPYDVVAEKIIDLNNDNNVVGIMVQQPYPVRFKGIEKYISPKKDVDGLCPTNMYKTMMCQTPYQYPATPQGIMLMLDYYKIHVEGKSVAILGRSDIVGKPMAAMMLARNANPIVCHSKTPLDELKRITAHSDIIISAVGRAKFINEYNLIQDIRDGVAIYNHPIIIDVGINRDNNGKVCGDVDFEAVSPYVSKISPVPKGVGLCTVASLIYNCCKYEK